MGLFNDIDFNDDNDILASSILSNDVEKIAQRFAKEIDWMKVSYEIYDHYLIMLDKDCYKDYNKGELLTFDNIKLPFNPDCVYLTFKFNNNYIKIEYIQVYPYMYSTNKTRIVDDDFYIIKFANILYDEYGIITDKIIYGYDDITYNNVRDSFCLIYNKERRLSSGDYKISNGFTSNFPKLLNIKSECIADIVYIRQLSIQDETTCISLLNALLKQFNKVMVNTCTTYIDNIPIYQFDKKNLQFFNILVDNCEIRYDGDDYAVIDKNTINILNKQLSENMINNQLYKSLIESIAISIKRSLNEDRYDYAHNNSSTHLKERLNGVLMKKFGKSTFFNKSARRGNQDFIVRNINALMEFPSVFSVAVAERKKSSEDNFRINISRKGDLDILSDDNIKYILFPRYIGTSNIDYIVYMLKKEDVQQIYDNLTSILNKCKEEIKQGKRDRKTIKVNKSISDKYKNFLAPTAGGDGVCLSNNCLKELSVFTFKLYDNMY